MDARTTVLFIIVAIAAALLISAEEWWNPAQTWVADLTVAQDARPGEVHVSQAAPTGTAILSPEREEQIAVIEERLSEQERVRVVVELSSAVDAESFAAEHGLDPSTIKEYDRIPFLAAEVDQESFASLKRSGELRGVQEDILLRPTLAQSVPIIGGDDVTASFGYDGTGVAVAVLDTGVTKSHPAFGGRVVEEACYSTHDPASNVYSLCPGSATQATGPDTALDCDTSIDGCGHGTHVAGIVAANHSSGDGVAPGADIIAIAVFSEFTTEADCGVGRAPCAMAYFSDVLLGLQRVYALRDTYTIAAASMSLGGGKYTVECDASFPSLKSVMDDLRTSGIASVVASGNDGYTDGIGTPACISTAISVGATTKADAVASYSNSASLLDVLAPGSSIYAPVTTGGYGYKSGTSMATPHVSGAFALLRDVYPDKSVDDLLAALEATGTNLTKSGVTRPRIDVDLAVRSLISVTYDAFDGNTTDFLAAENLSNVCDPVVENSSGGRISFEGCVDAVNADLNRHIRIERNTVSVNSSALASWNRSANITFYNTGLSEPIVVDDDRAEVCEQCTVLSSQDGDVVVRVEHFSSYTLVENLSLFLNDTTDAVQRETGQDVLFSANLSYTNNTPISDATCAVSFSTPTGLQSASMSYNATSTFYEHARSFVAGGTYSWNVTCTHTTNPTIRGSDAYSVTEYGTLRAEYESHAYGDPHSVEQDALFPSAAALYCDGNGLATCGDITAYHRDNRTGVLSATATAPTTPVYSLASQPQTCSGLTSEEPCYLNWTLNASGASGERFLVQINFSSDASAVSSLTSLPRTMEIASFSGLSDVRNVSVTLGETGSYAASSNAVTSAPGNISEVVVHATVGTTKWQGFYGSVADSLALGDGSDVFYSFDGLDAFAVVATPSTSFRWDNISAASPADVDTHWNFLDASHADQAVDTFERTKFFGNISDVPYVTLHEYFYSGITKDEEPSSKDDLGFIGIINGSGAPGFKNRTLNYELLVPVESGTETYYLFLAIS